MKKDDAASAANSEDSLLHASAEAQASLDKEAGLARRMTSGQIAMIGLSGALGTGLFLGSGSMIAIAGPAIILSYTLTGLVCLAVVYAMAEMTSKHPVHGGFGASAAAYGGPFLGYMSRWNVAITMILAVGVEVTAASKYIQFWWPDSPAWLLALAFSVLILAINLAGAALYGASEYWFSILKVAVVIIFILLGLVIILFGLPGKAPTGFHNLYDDGGFMPNGIGSVFVGAAAAIFSFGGAENVSLAAAEAQDPEHDVPRAARSMIFRLLIFYIGAMFIVVTLQPWQVSAASGGDVKQSPFVAVLASTGLPGAADFMNFVLIIAALSAGNGCLYAGTRMLHSLAVDHMAPRWMAHTSKNGAPRRAVAMGSLGMVIAVVLSYVLPSKVFGMFFGVLIMGLLMTWIYISIAHIFFRKKRDELGLSPSNIRLAGGATMSKFIVAILSVVAVYLAFNPDYVIAWQVGVPVMAVIALLYLAVPKEAKDRIRHHNVLTEELAALGREEQ